MAEVSTTRKDLKDARLTVLILASFILRLAPKKTRKVMVEVTAPPHM